MSDPKMTTQMREAPGFVAALDQSGGSTPKALKQYGVDESAYSGDAEMFDQIHAMRSRIVTSPAFSGSRVIGAILFEMTMERDVNGQPTAEYLWQEKGVVPFLKIDTGLEEEADSVQLMKEMPGLDARLDRAAEKGVFGTKERSVIHGASESGIRAIVAQQIEVGKHVLSHDMMPILEPEINITIADKVAAEDILLSELKSQLDSIPDGQQVMLKLTLPTNANQYAELVEHPKVMRVVALSGGYTREEANRLLALNKGMIASFSRALAEGLSAQQTEDEFDAMLDGSIQSIYDASISGT